MHTAGYVWPVPCARTAAKGEISRERRRLPAHVTVTLDLASAGRCVTESSSPFAAPPKLARTARNGNLPAHRNPLHSTALRTRGRGAAETAWRPPSRRVESSATGTGAGTPVTATDTAGTGRARRERTRAGAVGGVPRLPRRAGPGKGPGYVERRIAGARPCVRPAGRGSAAWDLAALRYVHRGALNYTPVICPNYGMWARLGAVDVRIMMIGKVAAQPLRRMLVPKAQHKTACLNIKGDVLTNLLEEHKRWDKEIRYIKAGISS
jgi:hypothetical protein